MRNRSGFTLIEIIVAIAVMLILAATITPTIVRQVDRARIDGAARQLEGVAEAVQAFNDDLGERTGPPRDRREYPAALTQLTEAVATSDANLCGRAYDAADVGQWAGPYLDRVVPPTGLPTAIGTLDVAIAFQEGGGNDLLFLVVRGVVEEDALLLDEKVDGDGASDTGTIRWSPPDAQGLVELRYTLPIGQACP